MKEHIALKLAEIVPYKGNPRSNERAVPAVMESIQQCTYINDIVVDEDNVILAGHTRYKALKRLGYTEADVCRVTGLTPEQKRKYRLLDNKTGEIAQWDEELLKVELDGLDFDGFDFQWNAGGDTVMDKIVEDEPPELDDEHPALTQYGDIYLLGRHRVMCGDSTAAESVNALMDGLVANLLLTDPPYNVDYQSDDGKAIMNDRMSDEDFRSFLHKALEQADAHMKDGAVFYIWHADSNGYSFRGACKDAGWPVRQCLIWLKNSPVMGRQDYQWKHEPCLYGWKGGASHFWARDRKQSTILEFDRPTKSKEHPTMKPVKLFTYQVMSNTVSGGVVLDLFGGSGTTMAACEQIGRTSCTMELDPKYVDVIVRRYLRLTGGTEQAFVIRGGKKATLAEVWPQGELTAFATDD
ncbi:MAG: DNA modification methylase [Clostridia bacterium]